MNEQKTITLNVQRGDDAAALSTETMTLRFCSEDAAPSETDIQAPPDRKQCTTDSCHTSSSSTQSTQKDIAKEPKISKIEKVVKPSPVKKSARLQAQQKYRSNADEMHSKEMEERILSGFLISFNSVLNSEVNDLMLVNHLDSIDRKTTLTMVEDFLSADIHTLPSQDQIPDSVFCHNSIDVLPDQQINLDQVDERSESLPNVKSTTFDPKSSTTTLSPIKMIQFDKSSQSFSPNFAARRRNSSSPSKLQSRKTGFYNCSIHI